MEQKDTIGILSRCRDNRLSILKKIISQIQEQIKIDSLRQLKFYRNFDKIMKESEPVIEK